MNWGSEDSLKVSVRWGYSPNARQIDRMACPRSGDQDPAAGSPGPHQLRPLARCREEFGLERFIEAFGTAAGPGAANEIQALLDQVSAEYSQSQ
jgi:hypothetical protein